MGPTGKKAKQKEKRPEKKRGPTVSSTFHLGYNNYITIVNYIYFLNPRDDFFSVFSLIKFLCLLLLVWWSGVWRCELCTTMLERRAMSCPLKQVMQSVIFTTPKYIVFYSPCHVKATFSMDIYICVILMLHKDVSGILNDVKCPRGALKDETKFQEDVLWVNRCLTYTGYSLYNT